MNKKSIILLIAVLALTFIAFSSTLNNQFTNFDDDKHLYDNKDVLTLDVAQIFQNTVNNTYIPLTTFSFAVEHHFFGFNPFVYHLNNLLLHLVVVVLCFLIGQAMGLSVWATAIGAFLFGIHPLHVESVAWITERKDVLYGVFYLASVYSYIHYIKKKNIRFYVIAAVLGLLSILAKPMALSLPLVLLVFDWYFDRKKNLKLIWEKVPFFLYVIPIAWITYALNKSVLMFDAQTHNVVLVAAWTFTFYLKKFLFPISLSPLYDLPKPVELSNIAYLSSFGVIAVLLFLIIYFRRNRLWIFACAFFLLSIFFLIRFKTYVGVNIVADRFMYLPSFGFCLVFGDLCVKTYLKGKQNHLIFKGLTYLYVSAILITFSVMTFKQCEIWKDSIAFRSYVIKMQPHKPGVYFNRAKVYTDEGKLDLALEDYNKAVQIDPDYSESYVNRGVHLLLYTPFHRQALADINKAIELDEENADAYHNRGLYYLNQKIYDSAIRDFSKAIKYDPGNSDSYSNRGMAYQNSGRANLALKDYAKAIELDNDFAAAYVNRASLYQSRGQYDLAIDDYNSALLADPELIVCYYARALSFEGKRDYQNALDSARIAKSKGYANIQNYIEKLEGLLSRQ